MNRKRRLQSGKSFIAQYEGKSLVKGYAKKYGIDKICAIIELRILGVEISVEYEAQIRENMRQKAKKKTKNKHETSKTALPFFIAGETSKGVPFGIIYDDSIDYLDEQLYFYEDGEREC